MSEQKYSYFKGTLIQKLDHPIPGNPAKEIPFIIQYNKKSKTYTATCKKYLENGFSGSQSLVIELMRHALYLQSIQDPKKFFGAKAAKYVKQHGDKSSS